MQKNVTIDWYDFQNNIVDKLKYYVGQTEFADVTLVTKDNKKISAHKIILCSGSTFFRGLFARDNGHPNPLLYLRGVEADVLEAVLQFLYLGQAQVRQQDVQEFIATAEDLGVEGLVKNNEKE